MYTVRLINFDNRPTGTYETLADAQKAARATGFEAGIYDENGFFITSTSPIWGDRPVAEALANVL